MKKISTKELFKNAFLAVIRPREKFKEINNLGIIDYKKTIPWMLIIGAISHIFSFFFLFRLNAFITPSFTSIPGVALIEESFFFRFSLWVLGIIFFYIISKIFRKDVSVKKIEIGVFYLWFIFILMPIFDLPHLWISVKYFEGFSISGKIMYFHFAYIFAIIVGFYETLFFLKKTLRFEKRKEKIFVFLIAPLPFILGRFLEDFPRAIHHFLGSSIKIGGFYYIFVFLGLLFCFLFWYIITKSEKKKS